jgi:hypothetical protein
MPLLGGIDLRQPHSAMIILQASFSEALQWVCIEFSLPAH